MDRSFFRRPGGSSRDSSPLLPQHHENNSRGHGRSSSYPLSDLEPRIYTDGNGSPSHSRSPVPSSRASQLSTSPRSTDSTGQPRVQFSQYQTRIPPPIASVILKPASTSQSQLGSLPISRRSSGGGQGILVHDNPLSALTRREKALQAELQILLDAQSVGLVQGRSSDTGSDAGSSTPTQRTQSRSRSGSRSRHNDNGVLIPVRQPRKMKLSLKGARRGILGTMEALGVVKEEEAEILQADKRSLEQALKQVLRWEKKLERFEEVTNKLSSGNAKEGREELELKTEKSAVETEIRELEERLLQLQARDRNLEARIRQLSNRREAELSSFKAGKHDVEREVGEWLKRPGVRDIASMVAGLSSTSSHTGSENGSNDIAVDEDNGTIPFLSLPPQRRTLPLASSWLTSSLTAINAALNAISHEHSALFAGVELWAETVGIVGEFEEALRTQMKEDSAKGRVLGAEDIKNQIAKMEETTSKLEQKEAVAQREGWNLLICAIGAEVEAFREGEALLREVLSTLEPIHQDSEDDNKEDSFLTAPLSSEDDQDRDQDVPSHENELDSVDTEAHKVELEGLQDLSLSRREERKSNQKERYRDASPTRSESEDDGPPEGLLVDNSDD